MSRQYRLSDEAISDIREGYQWYESKRAGLGEEFLSALDEAQASITKNPATYRLCYQNRVRRYVVSNFPYLILYIVNDQFIDIISVFNTYQHPDKWKERIDVKKSSSN